MNEYEVAILFHPDLELDLDKGTDKVKKLIEDNDGKVTSEDSWGKRKLAYPIAKNEHAVYVFFVVEMPGPNVVKLESSLNITDEVIRFLITKIDRQAIAKAEVAKSQRAKRREGKDKQDQTKSDEANE